MFLDWRILDLIPPTASFNIAAPSTALLIAPLLIFITIAFKNSRFLETIE